MKQNEPERLKGGRERERKREREREREKGERDKYYKRDENEERNDE